MTRLGTWRATYLVSLSCVGSFLFAYDTGIVGGVLTLDSFVRDMGFSDKERDNVTSLSASLLQAGGMYCICTFIRLVYGEEYEMGKIRKKKLKIKQEEAYNVELK